MPQIRGFPPISRADAQILILGSMPSKESLRSQQYYAHPRNGLWPILGGLFKTQTPDWPAKVRLLHDKRIALWDVLQCCTRKGSLDSAIDMSSVVVNDFETLFCEHADITHVFFNGAKAEQMYRRHVLPALPQGPASLSLQRLPSTSPAHASLNFEQKKSAWRVILETLQSVHQKA